MSKNSKMTKISNQAVKKITFVKSGDGFTMIEMLIGIAIFVVLSLGLVALVSNLLVASVRQSGQIADSDQARRLVFKLINELRNSQSGADGAYALNLAQSQQIVFFSNVDTDITAERVRYYLSSGKLYKGVTEYSGSVYNTSTEQSIVVQNNVANASSAPLFYYFDQAYDGSSTAVSLTEPVDVTDVRLVKLNLQVYNKGDISNTKFYTVTAGGSIRALKTNLGD